MLNRKTDIYLINYELINSLLKANLAARNLRFRYHRTTNHKFCVYFKQTDAFMILRIINVVGSYNYGR